MFRRSWRSWRRTGSGRRREPQRRGGGRRRGRGPGWRVSSCSWRGWRCRGSLGWAWLNCRRTTATSCRTFSTRSKRLCWADLNVCDVGFVFSTSQYFYINITSVKYLLFTVKFKRSLFQMSCSNCTRVFSLFTREHGCPGCRLVQVVVQSASPAQQQLLTSLLCHQEMITALALNSNGTFVAQVS